MADYWMTFRLHDDASYKQRYSDFIDTVNKNGTGFWSEPTSFICIRTTSGISALGAALKKPLGSKDLMVIREIGVDNTVYAGVPGTGFAAFFPNAKKL